MNSRVRTGCLRRVTSVIWPEGSGTDGFSRGIFSRDIDGPVIVTSSGHREFPPVFGSQFPGPRSFANFCASVLGCLRYGSFMPLLALSHSLTFFGPPSAFVPAGVCAHACCRLLA